ncbi:MAG TPA: hypothetical protein VI731_03315, partial [Bacteroidia bacterium]|nr:hypothetical protein [Bacteroidia bacterium]
MVHAKTFLLIILISFAGCKSKNGATQSDSDSQPIVTSVAVPEQPSETPDTVNEVPAPTPNKQDSSQLYRLTVSFISTGAGIDYKTAESFEKWLKE